MKRNIKFQAATTRQMEELADLITSLGPCVSREQVRYWLEHKEMIRTRLLDAIKYRPARIFIPSSHMMWEIALSDLIGRGLAVRTRASTCDIYITLTPVNSREHIQKLVAEKSERAVVIIPPQDDLQRFDNIQRVFPYKRKMMYSPEIENFLLSVIAYRQNQLYCGPPFPQR